MISSSLDWSHCEANLLEMTKGLSFEKDLKKIILNIRSEVNVLSKYEVVDRRRGTSKSKDILDKINTDIDMVKEYITVGKLLG